jgi:hypothetical protein
MYCLLHTARAQFWLPGPDDPEIWTNQFHACRKNSDMKQYRASSRKVVLRTRAVCRAHWWVLSCTGDDGRRRTQVDLGPAEQVTCASRTEMYERQEIRSVKAAPPVFPPPSDSASSAAAPRPSPVQELDTRAGAAPRRAKSPANIPYSGTGRVSAAKLRRRAKVRQILRAWEPWISL